jgi:2-hydroxy-3-keto-5-methylthiopentenyl-1-phosphate phosphatase
MRIFCDFDGTISTIDTTDLILSKFADPRWQQLEADWIDGRIDAASCMRQQIGLIAASDIVLDAALDTVELSPGFADFVAWCESSGYPLTIVSDGVDRFITRILVRHGLERVGIVSNRLAGNESARSLDQPWLSAECRAGSGVCKCAAAAAGTGTGPMVYVGDGRSDVCVAGRADILFAKGTLADYATRQDLAYHPFSNFHHVLDVLCPVRARRTAGG